MPLKPILILWISNVENQYSYLDFDEISLSSLEESLDLAAETVHQVINCLLIQEMVLELHSNIDFKKCIDKVNNWIKKDDEENILEDLWQERLSSKKYLSNFEKKIFKNLHLRARVNINYFLRT
jgi:hypothetical protein